MTHYPETPAGLFDLLQELFGIGSGYDEHANPDPPWFKVRMNEIGKIKRLLAARRVEVRTLAIAAYYCHRHQIPIELTGELFEHIAPALIELRVDQQQAKAGVYQQRIQRAAEEALARGFTETADRLLRMPIAGSEAVLSWIEKSLGITP